jgi:type II secretory pathway pseudopilin PulG
MESSKNIRYSLVGCTAVAAVIVLLVSGCMSQTTQVPGPEVWPQELNKYPGLLPEFGRLMDNLKRNVQFPAARSQSSLLPLLSPSTTFYVGLPNYGEPAHQALAIFREELKQSPVLRDWSREGDRAKTIPQVEQFIEKFYELSQYLGEETVIFGEPGTKNHDVLMIAEVRKPGLKEFLQQLVKELPDKSKPDVRILDLKELSIVKNSAKAEEFVVLVRPDFVIAGPGLEAVRTFNKTLQARSGGFASSPFGQRLLQTYQGGTSVVAGGDLHKMLKEIPSGTLENQKMLDRAGFNDVKYLIWNHKQAGEQSISETELSFLGPRHGVASWLAAPKPLGSLDFVSPKAALVISLGFKNLAEIFDDVKELSTYSNQNAFAMLPQMEQAMQISLRDDLLSQLQGEITVEVEVSAEGQPTWNAILRVNDPNHLQKTLDRLLLTAPMQTRQFDKEGVHYHAILLPSPQKAVEVAYTFVDGYMVIGSSTAVAAQAIQLHRSGESLAKSTKFLASLRPGYPPEMSALFYEDFAALMALQMRQLSPELTSFPAISESLPIAFTAYGEERAIRAVSTSAGANPTAVLAMAAIAIPNLLRARTAANESSAVSTLRTVNVAEIIYSSSHPQRGYARDLAELGSDPRGPGVHSTSHASLIDPTLGNATCTASAWCSKSGYNFNLRAICRERGCKEFVAVGTPATTGTGTKNFCSTSDGVIRFNVGPPVTALITASECRKWAPLQ